MPYTDNLYSADDSDVESFSNELSPTDGYFSNSRPSSGCDGPDPSLETGPSTAELKAQEVREEATASSASSTWLTDATEEINQGQKKDESWVIEIRI